MKTDPNLLDLFIHWELKTPDKPFLNEPVSGEYKTITWGEAGNQVRKMANYLVSLSLPPKSHIAILGKNSAHWIMADLAIMMSGHVSIPLYPNLTSEQLNLILEHSESNLLFIGKLDQFEELKKGIPENMPCISFPFYPHPGYPTWDDLIADQEGGEFSPRNNYDLYCILYTSGTTGTPKGVMHTFGNFAFALKGIKEVVNLKNETFFSYLPLCHVAEKMVIESASLLSGGAVFFAESIDTFAKDLAYSKPTLFLAVPRIWTKFQESILAKLPQSRLNLLLSIPIINTILKKSIKKKLGLTRARIIFSGAAPISTSLLEWFKKLGIHIQEAYGMTENLSYSHFNRPGAIRIGSVGQALPRCEVKISEQSEVLVKSEATMRGYFKDQEQTNEIITSDGFLKTGDEGRIDEEGFLYITGRVKDIFKTSKGKYIAPAPIEKMIMSYELVSQTCVVGSGLPQPIALITIPGKGTDIQENVIDHFKTILEESNEKLAAHEQLRKIVLFRREWTVGDILTPSLKIKRRSVEAIYGARFESWYEEAEDVIFG